MISFQEFEVWLSGGAGNTDGEASLGGARSTAARVGRQSAVYVSGDQTGITVTDLMRSGEHESTYSDNPEGLIVEDVGAPPAGTDATLYWNGGADSAAGTTGTGTVAGVLLEEMGHYAEFTINYNTVVQNNPSPPHSGTEVVYGAAAAQNELYDQILEAEYTAGEVKYRCIYLLNNGGVSMTADCEMWLSNHGQPDKDGNIINPPGANQWTYEIGLDPAGKNAAATTIANENAAPAGVTFYDANSVGLVLPELLAGEYVAVWIKMTIPAGYAPTDGDFDPAASMPGWLQFYVANDLGANDTQFYISFGFEIIGPVLEEAVADSATFSDETDNTWNWPEDTFTASDSVAGNMELALALSESVVTSDTAALLRTVADALEETITFTESWGSQATFGLALVDNVVFAMVVSSDNEVLEGWVLNADTNAASLYEWGAFNSLTRFDGSYYGATPEGLFELTGDEDGDDAIEAFVMTGVDNLGVEQDKRIIRGYIGVRTDGTLLFKTVVGNNVTRVYKLRSTNDSMMSRRLPLGRGVDSYYWQFGLENANGADFELDVIRVFPVVLGRRFR